MRAKILMRCARSWVRAPSSSDFAIFLSDFLHISAFWARNAGRKYARLSEFWLVYLCFELCLLLEKVPPLRFEIMTFRVVDRDITTELWRRATWGSQFLSQTPQLLLALFPKHGPELLGREFSILQSSSWETYFDLACMQYFKAVGRYQDMN